MYHPLSYLFHAWINANGMIFLYIWRSINYTLYMYHPYYKMEHNMLCLFSIPYVFWTRQQNNNKGESWKIQQHRIRKGPTVYTDKIDICFSQCKFLFLCFLVFFFWFVFSFTLKALSSVTSWNNFKLEFYFFFYISLYLKLHMQYTRRFFLERYILN